MEEINAYYTLTRKAFDLLAPVYNLITLPLFNVREKVVESVNAAKGETVLDIATGTASKHLLLQNMATMSLAWTSLNQCLTLPENITKPDLSSLKSGMPRSYDLEKTVLELLVFLLPYTTCLSQ